MSQNKKSYSEFIADKLLLQLQKITVPKSQRLMVFILERGEDYGEMGVRFKWYDSKVEFINDIRKKKLYFPDNSEILLEVVCRNKQVVMNNPRELYEDYLNTNK
tara:strand:+ start:289 stop:600 length:312 start_codon:yes stop_codon:yes gene_type:complete